LSVRFRLEPESSNSHRFELYRPLINGTGTRLVLKVIKAIIIRGRAGGDVSRHGHVYARYFWKPLDGVGGWEYMLWKWTHIHTRTHTHTHKHTQAHTRTHIQKNTHANTHIYTNTYTHTHANKRTHTNHDKHARGTHTRVPYLP